MASVSRSPSFISTPAIWLGVPGLAALALYAQLFPSLAAEWVEFPSLSHGFAVPFIAAYLIWSRRERLAAMRLQPSLWGFPVLLLGLGLLVVGVRGEEPFIARVSLPVTVMGLTMFLAGLEAAKLTWIGIAYLFFMVPLPYTTLKAITYESRLFDAAVSAHLLGWLGVPVHRDGVLLHLPDITLEVADACSSIPAISALLSLGVAYAWITPRPTVLRVGLIAVTLPIAITSNIIRIALTSAAVYYIGPWTLATVFHLFNGTVNFMFTLLFLLFVDSLAL
ncbi:MAG: exosortase/archaeosortase family protein, partial [Candidatus Rokuibacteriota bacterium]